ncbi:MAG: tRNA pseudouridine65 synthase, partial [Pirellulaceae bacterium]
MPELEILYRDEHIVAVNKPVGMLVHRTKLATRVREIAMRVLRKQLKKVVYPIHRLDRPTSGVLLFSLTQEAARAACELFEQHAVEKEYLAIVRGYVDDVGSTDMPLLEHQDRITDVLAEKDKPAQEALTHYRTLARVEYPRPVGRYQTARYSLVELTPKTGRRHQIRRHLKHLNHP